MAAVIWRSVGPSGSNAEYLFRLEEALGGLEGKGGEGSGGDGHVRDLAERVRELGRMAGDERERGGQALVMDGDGRDHVVVSLAGVEAMVVTGQGKGDEQAETEKKPLE